MAAPPKYTSIADSLGVPPDQLHADIKIRPPEDQGKAEREHRRDVTELWIKGVLAVLGLLLCAFLSWLFLYYGKSEEAEKVIAALLGFLGGIGVGRKTVEK